MVDLPPGTGDAQLTMAQRVPLAGADYRVDTAGSLRCWTPAKVSTCSSRVDVPVLGIIENMSYYECARNAATEPHIFGHGGARDNRGRSLDVPISSVKCRSIIEIRETSDQRPADRGVKAR